MVVRSLIIWFVSSVHCAVGSTVMVSWSGASDGLQAPQLDPNSIGRTGLRDDGLTVAVGTEGLTGCARLWLQVLERLPDVFPSCVENGFPVNSLEQTASGTVVTDLYP